MFGVRRESELEERQRKDAEKAADNKARQIRLGHIPRPEALEEEEGKPPKPKAKSSSRAKTTE